MINALRPKLSLDQGKIKEFLGEEYSAYRKLKEKFKDKPMAKKSATIYYPGSGSDIVSLLVVQDIFLPHTKEIHFFLDDIRDCFDGALYHLERVTKKSKIKVKSREDRRYAIIKYKDKTIHIHFFETDAMQYLPSELRSNIDIYYERAFELFRSNDTIGFHRIHSNVKQGGLLMSDYGFNFGSYQKNFKKLSAIPKKFGHYKKFQIWQRVNQ